MFDKIEDSFPPIEGQLDAEKNALFEKLPKDYREFLQSHNGGFVEEFRYTFLTGVPYKMGEIDNPSRDDCPVEFFGIPTTDKRGRYPQDLFKTVEEYTAEEFLPRRVIAIARCIQSSLVCISLRDDDHGAIYYWDWYWNYPWCQHFFDQRIERVKRDFADYDAIVKDTGHPLYWQIYDQLNFATLTKIASSFSEWFAMCEDRRDADDS